MDIEAYKQYTELQNKLQAVEQQTKSLAATPQVCYYQLVMKECALSTGNLPLRPRNSVARLPDCSDMTFAIYHRRKMQTQTDEVNTT